MERPMAKMDLSKPLKKETNMYLISASYEKALTDDLLRQARHQNKWREDTEQCFVIPPISILKSKYNPSIRIGNLFKALGAVIQAPASQVKVGKAGHW
jgi:hypothetical protein